MYPLPQIRDLALQSRKIGLGVMGFADILLKMGIRYGSKESIEVAETVMSFISEMGEKASRKLAEERGEYPLAKAANTPGMRNNTVTTIAPTGTLSIIADCSSGIEPLFSLGYYRNAMDGTKLPYINNYLKTQIGKNTPLIAEDADVLINAIIQNHGSLQGLKLHGIKFANKYSDSEWSKIDEVIDWLTNVFVCAHDISPEEHIRVQAAFQKYTDNAISKTINFSNDATRENVRTAYMLAYELGCKGTTIYRDGCRDTQVLNNYSPETPKAEGLRVTKIETPDSFFDLPAERKVTYIQEIAKNDEMMKTLEGYWVAGEDETVARPRTRPVSVTGFTKKVPIGCGNLYVTVNHDDWGVCEIFTNTGKSGGCPSQSEASARLASIALRSGVSIDEVIHQLRGIRCPACQRNPNVKVLSCPDAIGRMLEEAKEEIEKKNQMISRVSEVDVKLAVRAETPYNPVEDGAKLSDADLKFARSCPECGAPLEHEGGCVMCRECGWSKCN